MGQELVDKMSKLMDLKFVFMGIAFLAACMVIVMHGRLGQGTMTMLHEALFEKETSLFEDLQQHRDPPDEVIPERMKSAESAHIGRHHHHNTQVGFVLRESLLGAPEFLGKNLKDSDLGGAWKQGGGGDTLLNQNFDGMDSPSYSRQLIGSEDVKIAIGCALTTREQKDLNRENIATELPFFKGLLVSFCATATRGFDYHFYVSHDHSDPFFRVPGAHDLFEETFNDRVKRKCARRLNVTLHLVECEHSGRPAWAQNDAMMAAYMDNMDYYYRINDDTVMETTGWTEKFIDELARYNPENVGVVGPWFKEGNVVILTHDFVHRTHVDIFGFYYPRVFTDWFADDWITGVYWPERSRKVPGTRVRHTMEKGQRYVAHYEKAGQIRVEVEIGKRILQRYIDRRAKVDSGSSGSATWWDSNVTSVVSMTLQGDSVKELYGTLRYSQLLPVVLPGWRLRVYTAPHSVQSRVQRILVRKLELSGVEVVRVDNSTATQLRPALWSYLIIDDPNVKQFIIRNVTTRPTEREAAALEDWRLYHPISPLSSTSIYCIRDHPTHRWLPLVAGLIGGVPELIRNLTGGSIRPLLVSHRNLAEQEFLETILWPLVRGGHVLCHDSVSCTRWEGSEPYPALRRDEEFVGQSFDSNDQPLNRWELPVDDGRNSTVVAAALAEIAEAAAECVFVKGTGFEEGAVKAVVRHGPVSLWAQDYHVTPMMDIKSLLSPIGVKILDNSLSFYCKKVGTCAKGLKVINSDNGMSLGAELIDKFYKAYKHYHVMNSVTAFVCTLPVAMCEAFIPFNKSIIIISTVRYEQARTEPARWRQLNSMLHHVANDSRSVLAANNLYDAKYIEYFTGLTPLVLPNYCEYLGATTYTPTRRQFLLTPIHSTELYDIIFAEFDATVNRKGVDLVMFPLREMYPQYLYSDLASHKGIVYVPYQVSMVSLTEQYRMNIPLFFPSIELLARWHIKYQVVRQRTWNSYLNTLTSQSAIPGLYPQVPDPNNDFDEDAVRYWLQFADFYRWPHIIYFESIPDLVDKMLGVDLGEVSKRMMKYNTKVRDDIKNKWSKVLMTITRASSTSRSGQSVRGGLSGHKMRTGHMNITGHVHKLDRNVKSNQDSKVVVTSKAGHTNKDDHVNNDRHVNQNDQDIINGRESKAGYNKAGHVNEHDFNIKNAGHNNEHRHLRIDNLGVTKDQDFMTGDMNQTRFKESDDHVNSDDLGMTSSQQLIASEENKAGPVHRDNVDVINNYERSKAGENNPGDEHKNDIDMNRGQQFKTGYVDKKDEYVRIGQEPKGKNTSKDYLNDRGDNVSMSGHANEVGHVNKEDMNETRGQEFKNELTDGQFQTGMKSPEERADDTVVRDFLSIKKVSNAELNSPEDVGDILGIQSIGHVADYTSALNIKLEGQTVDSIHLSKTGDEDQAVGDLETNRKEKIDNELQTPGSNILVRDSVFKNESIDLSNADLKSANVISSSNNNINIFDSKKKFHKKTKQLDLQLKSQPESTIMGRLNQNSTQTGLPLKQDRNILTTLPSGTIKTEDYVDNSISNNKNKNKNSYNNNKMYENKKIIDSFNAHIDRTTSNNAVESGALLQYNDVNEPGSLSSLDKIGQGQNVSRSRLK